MVARTAKFYPATATAAKVDHLEIRYEVPPTSGQRIALSIFTTLFIVLLVPGAQLLILSSRQKITSKSQKWIIGGGVLIEIMIVIVIIVLSIMTWDLSTIISIGNLVVSGLGGAATILVYYREKKGSLSNVEQRR